MSSLRPMTTDERDRTLELGVLWDRVWARRRLIAALVLGSSLIASVIALVLPPWYRADATLLPPSEEESGVGLASLLKTIGVAGVKVPTQATPSDVFLAILESRRVNEEIVRRFDLKNRYRVHFMVDAVKRLHSHAHFKATDAGTIEVSVEDRDPVRAAAMANAYLELLDRFNREVRMTKGRRTREFVEQRLKETKDELALSEQRFADYQAKHKTAVMSREMTTAADAAAQLYAQRTGLQVRLGVVQSYTRGPSDEALQISQQLAQLDRQLAALPETGLEVTRMYRDVRTLEQVYVLLTAQYEQARIDEARDITTIEILDPASPPEKKSRPMRTVIVAATFALTLGVCLVWAVLTEL
jgi:tyrosine-protein kinase Etk/Wzc